MQNEDTFIPYNISNLTGHRVIVFAPHPDDETFGCGGSILLNAAAGDLVKIVILTNGAQANTSETVAKNDYITLRCEEARNACAILGVGEPEFWNFEDRKLAASEGVLAKMLNLIETFEPELIYVPSPLEFHPDHRATVFWLEKAVRTCKSDFDIAFYEVNQPLSNINVLTDITPVIEQKKQAIQAYSSQLSVRPYGDIFLSLNRFRSFTLPPDVDYAEGFCLISAEIIRKKGILSVFCNNMTQISPEIGDAILSVHAKDMTMQENPIISVIVPTHSRKDMLKEALKSVLAQTYQDFEIIVVNDGGEDVCDVIDALNQHEKIIYLKHEDNRGPAAARNTGLKASKGKYIAYLDDDDLYYPNHLETLVSVLEQGIYKVAYTDSHERLQQWITDRYVTIGEKPVFGDEFDKQKLLVGNYIPTLNIAHYLDIIEETGMFDETLGTHEDWDLWIRFSRKYEFCHVPKITAAFTTRTDYSSDAVKKCEAFLTTARLIHHRYSHLISDHSVFEAQKKSDNILAEKTETASVKAGITNPEHRRFIYGLESKLLEKEIYLNKTVREKNEHIESLEKAVSYKDSHIRNLDDEISEKQEHIHSLNSTIDGKDKHIENLESLIADKDTHIENITSLLNDREAHIGNLEPAIRDKDIHIKNLETTIENLETVIRNLTSAIRIKDEYIAKAIHEKGTHIRQLEESIRNKDKEIADILYQKDAHLRQVELKATHIRNIEAELGLIKGSKVWRLAEMLRKFFYFRLLAKFPLIQKAVLILSRDGFMTFLSKTKGYLRRNKVNELMESNYDIWLKQHALTDEKIRHIHNDISKFEYKPKISIITPVYNVDQIWLEKAIESVINQLYPNWELCMVDDASPKAHIRQTLEKYAKKDKRIKVKYFAKNQGMSIAYNEALLLATGEFAGTLDHDDELTWDALYENIKLLNQNQNLDMIYSDEDKIDIQGKRSDPFFKPDYSPDLLLCMSYICHFTIFRREKLNAIGGFRGGYDGAQDYDIMLRFTEKTDSDKIAHIPTILYHWRKIPGSAALATDAKSYAYVAAKKALCDYLDQNKIAGDVSDGHFIGSYRLKRRILQHDKVSIIIPFKDEVELLEKCVTSILEKTDYSNYEILLVNNQSKEASTFEYLDKISNQANVRIIEYDKPFDFSAMNNYAAAQADGQYILMLNNDTEVISDEWLNAMVEHGQRKEVGAVGAKLLYPNNTIQHAGVVMGLGIASHAFKYLPQLDNGYFGLASVTRNCCAVTAACLLMRKEVFEELGGLDEKRLKIAYSDVDLCLKAINKGYRVIYTPYALLYHHESVSRGDDNDEALKLNNPEKYYRVISEREYMAKTWKKYIENDPYYNINLTRERDDFGIRI